MLTCEEKNIQLLGTRRQLEPVKTFECGQCFRWNVDSEGAYWGVSGGRAAKVIMRENEVYILCSSEEDTDYWRDYFDMALDYEAITAAFSAGEYLQTCARYGAGIRILRQDPWEALCSFILSQCNNIPRIKKIVETLCRCFGDAFCFDGRIFYAFPSAQQVAELTLDALAPLRCGYRAAYLLHAARAVASGEIDLDALVHSDTDTAMQALLSLDGVGTKVANCTVLFGLHHMEAFPVDVWMKRALEKHFPPNFDPATLGTYAGLAQQYIFYYERSGGNGKNE